MEQGLLGRVFEVQQRALPGVLSSGFRTERIQPQVAFLSFISCTQLPYSPVSSPIKWGCQGLIIRVLIKSTKCLNMPGPGVLTFLLWITGFREVRIIPVLFMVKLLARGRCLVNTFGSPKARRSSSAGGCLKNREKLSENYFFFLNLFCFRRFFFF